MIPTRIAAFAAILLALTVFKAEARPTITCNQQGCSDWSNASQAYKTSPGSNRRQSSENRAYNDPIESGAIIVGGRPEACNIRIRGRLIPYCGCGVSLKVFGKVIPELMLAANWKKKFPRTSPAPGMVAARSGHVFYIQSVIDRNTVIAYDPNSGGGRTRIHERSLRGYTVVNPYGSVALN